MAVVRVDQSRCNDPFQTAFGSMRRSKQEILDLYRACQAKLGRAPGSAVFCDATGIRPADVEFYWPRHSALVKEAGGTPNEFVSRLADDVVFEDYARVCQHLRKIPTQRELSIAERELKTKTSTVDTRFGSITVFRDRFRDWLANSPPEFVGILDFEGWNSPTYKRRRESPPQHVGAIPQLHPFLPACLQYLDVLARGEQAPFETSDLSVSTLFERRTADAFRCLGLEIRPLGQGTGRNADVLAVAPRERFAVIIDAKVRANGYVLGTEDRKFLDYAVNHGKELQQQGFERLYFVVVGPSFRESDLTRLTEYLSQSPIRSVAMVTARSLIELVEESIRERSHFTLGDLDKKLFGNKII
jgi:hypothetical protein